MGQEDKVQTLISKLLTLKHLDSSCAVFGSQRHKYSLRTKKTESEVSDFEKRFGILLPTGYRLFLTRAGNGGAGPYYGLESLEHSLFRDLDYYREGEFLDPSKPFPFSEPWNMTFEQGNVNGDEEYRKFEEQYYDHKWVTGLLRVCNFGCGVSVNLVVNGPEYGNISVDDRCNDGGIYPEPYSGQERRKDVLTWYEFWLDESIKEVQNR